MTRVASGSVILNVHSAASAGPNHHTPVGLYPQRAGRRTHQNNRPRQSPLLLATAERQLDNEVMAKQRACVVMVHNAAEAIDAARAAASAGKPVTIVSPPGAALFAGPIWFKALTDAAREEIAPTAAVTFMLDCADSPGAVMAAIRARIEAVSFHGNAQALARLAAIAKSAGVILQAPPAAAVDLSKCRGPEALVALFSSRFSPPRVSLQTHRRSAKRTARHGPAPKRSGGGRSLRPTGAKRP